MKDYTIRIEKEIEHHEVEMLVREAFWNVYRPGERSTISSIVCVKIDC